MLVLAVAATIFQALPLTATAVNASMAGIPESRVPTESYFREHTASNLLYAHILFMLLSWVGALPICVMLNIAGSNLRYPSHVAFLGLHGIGIILGLAYKSKTPDLYPGNSHNKLGWVLTVLIFAHFIVGSLRTFTKHKEPDTGHELTPFISLENLEGVGVDPGSDHPNQSSSPRSISPYLLQSEDPTEETDSETLFDVHLHYNSTLERRFDEPIPWSRRWLNTSELHFFIQLLDIGYDFVLRFFLLLGFVAICTGIVTMVGMFHDDHIFNGLAHFIKGGVFFWIGILTLGRWMGCFSARGWAWNLQPLSRMHESMSMETVECSLIFLYGITNIFLEHMTAWGQAWSPMDFEHVAVSLLFIGGGLCGLMVESKTFCSFVEDDADNTHLNNDDVSKPANVRPHIPINPIPAMIIFLLGLILTGHHQMSMESTMMHNQVGNFLTGASAARCITYLLLHISPPISVYPSRPPSELICSFSLLCGGIMLMASNRDTVQSMIDNDVHAMFVATVTMGVMAMLMAWIIFALGVKGWAAAREERCKKKSLSRV